MVSFIDCLPYATNIYPTWASITLDYVLQLRPTETKAISPLFKLWLTFPSLCSSQAQYKCFASFFLYQRGVLWPIVFSLSCIHIASKLSKCMPNGVRTHPIPRGEFSGQAGQAVLAQRKIDRNSHLRALRLNFNFNKP